jgi:DNA replicative helicase MCM subunit Mcm2 (Cdc46/Mcm family)
MKTINAKKGELVNMINGLFSVQELKGKDFSLIVSKNITILKESLIDLENAGKPSDEFMALAEQVNTIANENKEDAKEQIDKLEEDNKELVDARRTQMDKVQSIMEEDAEVSLHIIKENLLPEEITAQQINKLIQIVE